MNGHVEKFNIIKFYLSLSVLFMTLISKLKITGVGCNARNYWIYYRLRVERSVIVHPPNIIMLRTNLNLSRVFRGQSTQQFLIIPLTRRYTTGSIQ
jgi:hypothetical protein